ncbi:MAG: cation diffusion facilitator family transporter [Thauera sp.]
MQAKHYFWLSTAAALVTIALKALAWQMTGSMGLASDAMESFVNLAGATFALWMITIARVPPDEDHPLGHGKAEYFSSGFEGLLIFGAAGAIIWSATGRLLAPTPLEAVGLGLAVSVGASAVNLFVALAMRRAARRFRSIALDGGARHLMTDVWTSGGVITGVALVSVTGWLWLDAVVAIAVGFHILAEGWHLIRASAHGLMDAGLEKDDLAVVQATLNQLTTAEIGFSNLRTRRAGAQSFVYVDVRVPGQWTVAVTHRELDRIERVIAAALPETVVFTHAEPADGASMP